MTTTATPANALHHWGGNQPTWWREMPCIISVPD